MTDVAAPASASANARRPTRRVQGSRHFGLIVAVVGFLLFWEASVHFFNVQQFILPPPSAVATKFAEDLLSGAIIPHFRVTLIEVLCGFFLAATLGMILGSAIALIGVLERTLYPFILALQTVPKIALAPLFLIWFGYGLQSKIVTAGLIAFFPVLVNVISGMRTVDPRRILLMRALNASFLQTFLKVRLPSMLPQLFAGLEVAIIFAVIGAIVGEFIGASTGLGSLIVQRQASVDVSGVFSVLVYLSLMGITLNFVLRLLARRFAFWQRSREIVSA